MSAITDVQSERGTTKSADELRNSFDAQRAAFARGAPDHRRRMDALAGLRDGLHAHQEEIVEAASADFGGRSREETLMLELFPTYEQIRHARRRLASWMKPRRVPSTWFLRPSANYIVHQPLGVVGVIGAWNYPLQLTIGPLVDALAAGNHVMVKLPEMTPRTGAVIAAVLGELFPPEYVTAMTGGPDVASRFAELPFDHLCFTGSSRVGSLVMRSAAANLTPVTLELGGKSPAIVHEDFPLETALTRILAGKLYNAGQTCVAPDYLLVPHARIAEVERLAPGIVRDMYPKLVDNPDYTRIADGRHYERLSAAAAEAAARGARVVPIDPAGESFSIENRVYPPTLVFDAPDDSALMREEIFGPILPVVGYRTLDEAIAHVNARPRPLALYYFDEARSRIDKVVRGTISGGVLVNDVVLHFGQSYLPFGGVGASGMGHYHGRFGFETFSKKKGVMVQSRFTLTGMFRPPYGLRTKFLLERLIRFALR